MSGAALDIFSCHHIKLSKQSLKVSTNKPILLGEEIKVQRSLMTCLCFLLVRGIAEVQEKFLPIIKCMVLGGFSVQQWIHIQLTEKLNLLIPGVRIDL